MNYIDREGNKYYESTEQDRLLEWLYSHTTGRLMIRPLVSPAFSILVGKLLCTKISALFVPYFIKKSNIDMSEYPHISYHSFNDFFTRKIQEGYRPLAGDRNTLISPCDGHASVYPISENTTFSIKHTEYSLPSLLRSSRLAKRYNGGHAIVLRLTVSDYHRYAYVANGEKSKNYFIPGIYHTVNPIANDYEPIYKENAREYTVLHTKEFGDIIQMEVGALMVGKISNHHEEATVSRGEEKGYFEFGGSTIVLLVKKDHVTIREDLLENTRIEYETIVHQGDALGTK